MISVACDICGRRYTVADERRDQRLACKSCDVEFEVTKDNEFDPDTPEFPEESPVEEEESGISWTQIAANTAGGICVIAGLAVMISLVFINPRRDSSSGFRPGTTPLSYDNDPLGPKALGTSLKPQSLTNRNAPRQGLSTTDATAQSGDSSETTRPAPSEMTDAVNNSADIAAATPPVNVERPINSNTPQFETPFSQPPNFPGPNFRGAEDAQQAMQEMQDKLRERMKSAPGRRIGGPPSSTGPKYGGFNYDGTDSIPSSDRPVEKISELRVGQVVQVEWEQKWWPAVVARIRPNDMVLVRIRGWSHNEEVPLKRIQLAHE